jgi:putative restriction endonuclease
MRRYWWVNHKRTFKQEIEGGYVWSPKRERNGAYSQFYQNLRIARPDDYIVSYANGAISYIGQVAEYAVTCGPPEEFGQLGDIWSHDGWLLPVAWVQCRFEIRPKLILNAIRHLLPEKYSPISASTGNGHQKAYLSEISKDLFEFLILSAGLSEDSFRGTYVPCTDITPNSVQEPLTGYLDNNHPLSITERIRLVNARIGQGVFRTNLQKFEKKCRITGISRPPLLIASHIKPWRLCSSSFERLDGQNGLLLAPPH